MNRATLLAAALFAAMPGASPAHAQEERPVRVPADTIAVAGLDTLEAPEVVPSEPIPFDEFGFATVPADTTTLLTVRFRDRGEVELARMPSEDVLPKNPRNAAIRSFLVPGWGQIYTGHPWRAVLFAVAEVGFLAAGYSKQLDALDKKDELRAAREAFFADPPEGVPPDDLDALDTAFENSLEARTIQAELDNIEDRREDFYAWGFLSVFFAAVDAYVSAQLDPVRVGVEPADRRAWAGVRIPLGGGERRR